MNPAGTRLWGLTQRVLFPDAVRWAEERHRVAVFAEHPSCILYALGPQALREEAGEDEEDEEEDAVVKPPRVIMDTGKVAELNDLYAMAHQACATGSRQSPIYEYDEVIRTY